MKKLSIEQKAKAYDEALERMKSWVNGEHPECFTEAQKAAEFIFPELKESEDERIRMSLIELFKDMEWDDSILHDYNMDKDKTIAWLEKAGEQKVSVTDFNAKDWYVSKVDGKIHDMTYNPANKVEPKFKVGDWVVFIATENVYQVEKIENSEYTLRYILGDSVCLSFSNEELIKEWTITDAKPGDVLVDIYNNIGIFQKCEGIYWQSYLYLGCNGELLGFSDGGYHKQTNTHPATKEQCDALEKAMADAGYISDSDKKEVKKIEQKPAWSKEDERMLVDCFNILHRSDYPTYKVTKAVDWLKSLKERVM